MHRKRLAVLLFTLAATTSVFADGVIGSGTRSEEDERAIIGSGGRSIFGSGGLQQRVSAAFTRLVELAQERGYFGSGN